MRPVDGPRLRGSIPPYLMHAGPQPTAWAGPVPDRRPPEVDRYGHLLAAGGGRSQPSRAVDPGAGRPDHRASEAGPDRQVPAASGYRVPEAGPYRPVPSGPQPPAAGPGYQVPAGGSGYRLPVAGSGGVPGRAPGFLPEHGSGYGPPGGPGYRAPESRPGGQVHGHVPGVGPALGRPDHDGPASGHGPLVPGPVPSNGPLPSYGPVPAPRPSGFSRPVPKSSTLALVSLVMGVLWLGGLGSVVGIVTGIVALGLVAAGRAAGRGMAIGGIAVGVVTLGMSGVLVASLLPVDSPPPDVHAQNRAEAPPPLPEPVDPASPYPVYGSQDMVRYMAQSMIKHQAEIDLRAYQLTDPAQAEDAVLEAVIQNPYVVDVRTYGCDTDWCRISYGYSAAEQAAIQQQLLDVSVTILAETVDESMTDTEKVTAINTWLTKNARYDTEAAALLPDEPEAGFDVPQEYRYAWNASGVLLDGKGVCESYAEAFHLLVSAAGVPVVIVSGYLLDGNAPHAWNKVFVDGQWKAVDVTWNDGPPTTDDYLLINDSQFTGEAARREDDQWMTDSLISAYATP